MKTIISKLIILALLVIIPYLIIGVNIEDSYKLKRDYLESQLNEVEVLSMGSSHGQSINPAYFSLKGFNLSNPSQDLYYDVHLANKYIDKMPELKLLIIPISYFSFESQLDNSPENSRLFPYLITWGIPPENFSAFLNDNFLLFVDAEVKNFVQNGFVNNATPKMDQDGWMQLSGALQDSPSFYDTYDKQGQERVKFQDSSMYPEQIPENMKILSNLIEDCQSRQIKIVLITTPGLHFYYDHMDPIRYQRMQDNLNSLKVRYEIPYFNYLKDPRFVPSDFANQDHLNTKGAEKFSKILDVEIIKKLTE